MSKTVSVSFLLLILVSYVCGSIQIISKTIESQKNFHSSEAEPEIDFCPYCVGFMNDAIDELLNAILNGGVIGGCGTLCGYLTNPILSAGCNLLCDYVGIQAFIDAINVTDPDPIYACQESDLCPVVNGGMVKVMEMNVDPTKGATGTTFNVTFAYKVTAATGPGLLAINIFPPDALGFGGSDFTEGQAIGEYEITWSVSTQPSEDEPFDAGVYIVQALVCEGDCTTDHPYGGVYAQGNSTFSIN